MILCRESQCVKHDYIRNTLSIKIGTNILHEQPGKEIKTAARLFKDISDTRPPTPHTHTMRPLLKGLKYNPMTHSTLFKSILSREMRNFN